MIRGRDMYPDVSLQEIKDWGVRYYWDLKGYRPPEPGEYFLACLEYGGRTTHNVCLGTSLAAYVYQAPAFAPTTPRIIIEPRST